MELSKIIIGGMRFSDRENAVKTIHAAIDAGFNYIDTSPCYCRKDEKENSESWIGTALESSDYRSRVMVSAKCSPGDGGYNLGEFNPEVGFGVRSSQQLKQVFNQSLTRLNMDTVDYYHLWTTHTIEQLEEAMKPNGWYDGVMEMSDKWDHLGVTTHAAPDTILAFLKTGKFETVTIPLNIINRTRETILDYCRENHIKVIAMNPFAGGFLAQIDELKELALRYLMSMENVYPLIGFSSPEEVKYAEWIQETMSEWTMSEKDMIKRSRELLKTDENTCTSCGYCQPCPNNINVGASLSYYNIYKYMHQDSAKDAFQEKQWEDGLRLDKCTYCGLCASRCPNNLPLMDIIKDANNIMYIENI
jgi:predicted aldo/keto reductase-like oxidoreductase